MDAAQQQVADVFAEHPRKKVSGTKGKELRQMAEDDELTKNILRTPDIQKQQLAEKENRINFGSTTLLRESTLWQALDDPQVMEDIENVLLSYARQHHLPLK